MGPQSLLVKNKHALKKGGFLKTCQLHNGRFGCIWYPLLYPFCVKKYQWACVWLAWSKKHFSYIFRYVVSNFSRFLLQERTDRGSSRHRTFESNLMIIRSMKRELISSKWRENFGIIMVDRRKGLSNVFKELGTAAKGGWDSIIE